MGKAAGEALAALVTAEAGARPANRVRGRGRRPRGLAVERLLERWDEDEATALFAMNVDLDEPLALRRAELERLREVHGRFRPDDDTPVESHAPSHLIWWLRGERGRLKVEMLLDPEVPSLVQGLPLTSVPEPPAGLAAIARRLADLLAVPGPVWPPDIALAPSLEAASVARSLRAAEALFGPMTLGEPIAGDGEKTATWRMAGERGAIDLTLGVDEPGGALTTASLVPVALEMPSEAV